MRVNKNPTSDPRPPTPVSHYISHSPEETISLGAQLGRRLFPGAVIALTGDLGSGKTCLVQGIAMGLAVPEEFYVTSPTYTIINEYPGRLALFHVDVYRLAGPGDLDDIGFDEIMAQDGLTVIEWAEKVADRLPKERLSISLLITGDRSRSIEIRACGKRYVEIIDGMSDVEYDN
jgi:tRNA threonylcarbamoyladenosine biosynthesis protein TsaE